jgi:hypothetical protein
LWVFSYATVDYNGLPMKHFQAVSNENKRLSTIESLNALLNSTFGLQLTLRDTENIICKAFRAGVRNPSTVMNRSSLRKKSKCHFRDLIFLINVSSSIFVMDLLFSIVMVLHLSTLVH